MSKMSDIHLVLTNLVDEGIQSGYFGNRLEEFVVDEASECYRIPPSITKGFVERKRSEVDRRVVYLTITDKGIELLETINKISGNYMEFTTRITEEEAKQVSDILDKIRG